ncbi:MAG: hypothetical protein IKZ09_07030 [Clostridia bacterium]|nr:hypothetical protein [Clostridia bacterium]
MENNEIMKNEAAVSPNPTAKPKRRTMQDDADELFALQMRVADEAKGSDRTAMALFLAFIFVLGALIFILPDKAFSEQENRALQQRPQLQSKYDGSLIERIQAGKFLDKYFSGAFAEDVGDYYSDQFPARDFFVGLKGMTEIAMLKGENNDVVLGADSYLLSRMDNPKIINVIKNYDASADFAARMAEKGISVTFAAAGRVIDVAEDKLPALYPVDTLYAPWDALDERAEQTHIDGSAEYTDMLYLNLRDPLRAASEAGASVMYRTDHHWTTYGAYLAYVELMNLWGMEALPASAFTVEVASDAFYGTAWRNAGMKWIEPDTMEFYRFEGDTDYTMTIQDDGTVFEGFYDLSYLEKTDKYSSFISGNHAYVTIEKNGDEDRERLMLVKDSFGHSLAPFLAYHFDLEIIDLRYYKNSTASLVEETGCDRVLIINNMDSLTSAVTLGMLGME